MANTLIPGKSTVAEAATAYGVPVARILTVLNDCLTDVYTPEGDGGVVSRPGRIYATVNGAAGNWRGPAADLVLASDSIAVLARYINA